MMTRDEGFQLLKQHLTLDYLIKHCLAAEAIMRKLAEHFGEDVEAWGLVGLLHDLDYDSTKDDPKQHSLKTAEILKEQDFPEELIYAITAHNAENTGVERKSRIDYAITCGESITGLIVATALVYPDKKVASVKPKSIKKRMKEKAFARNVDRDLIRLCEKIDLPLEVFIPLCLEAMCGISDELGL